MLALKVHLLVQIRKEVFLEQRTVVKPGRKFFTSMTKRVLPIWLLIQVIQIKFWWLCGNMDVNPGSSIPVDLALACMLLSMEEIRGQKEPMQMDYLRDPSDELVWPLPVLKPISSMPWWKLKKMVYINLPMADLNGHLFAKAKE